MAKGVCEALYWDVRERGPRKEMPGAAGGDGGSPLPPSLWGTRHGSGVLRTGGKA